MSVFTKDTKNDLWDDVLKVIFLESALWDDVLKGTGSAYFSIFFVIFVRILN